MKTFTKTFAGAALMASVVALSAGSANAGVTGCSASGGKQEAGAVIGGVLGGLVGHSVGGHKAGAETVVGVAAGAAAGSAIGCEAQKNRAPTQAQSAYRPTTYQRNGYRLSSDVSPASYTRMGRTFVATSGVKLRSAPTTSSTRVGSLRPGERFQALAQVRGTNWILVGENGVGVGYVRTDLVRPEGHRYAAGY